MRWDYLPLDINPVFPGLGVIIIIIVIVIIIIIIIIIIIVSWELLFKTGSDKLAKSDKNF